MRPKKMNEKDVLSAFLTCPDISVDMALHVMYAWREGCCYIAHEDISKACNTAIGALFARVPVPVQPVSDGCRFSCPSCGSVLPERVCFRKKNSRSEDICFGSVNYCPYCGQRVFLPSS